MKFRFAASAALAAISVSLLGCSSLPTSFTTENIMMVHRGMGADEVKRMFGLPKSVSQAVCGGATEHTWTCTTWEYGKFPDRATFTFASAAGSLVVNHFDIHRTGRVLPDSFTTENVMKVHQGMDSTEILRTFGTPINFRRTVCGPSGHQWTCTIWEYGSFPHDSATFMFADDSGALVLNNFDVHRH
ncbi:MAG: hypothetical protein JSS29_19435 [Proteobacteria bacterium]|nr:hypothetical protein [Pseudomonadota bacterium]